MISLHTDAVRASASSRARVTGRSCMGGGASGMSEKPGAMTGAAAALALLALPGARGDAALPPSPREGIARLPRPRAPVPPKPKSSAVKASAAPPPNAMVVCARRPRPRLPLSPPTASAA